MTIRCATTVGTSFSFTFTETFNTCSPHQFSCQVVANGSLCHPVWPHPPHFFCVDKKSRLYLNSPRIKPLYLLLYNLFWFLNQKVGQRRGPHHLLRMQPISGQTPPYGISIPLDFPLSFSTAAQPLSISYLLIVSLVFQNHSIGN